MIHEKHRYITKIYRKQKKLTGYIVRVPGFKKQSFYEHDYNGLKYALKEALHYRNDLLRTYHAQPNYTGCLVNKNNKSGMIGIHENEKNIIAFIKNNNKYTKVTYAIAVYGYETAFRLAINARIRSRSLGGIRSPIPAPIKLALNG